MQRRESRTFIAVHCFEVLASFRRAWFPGFQEADGGVGFSGTFHFPEKHTAGRRRAVGGVVGDGRIGNDIAITRTARRVRARAVHVSSAGTHRRRSSRCS